MLLHIQLQLGQGFDPGLHPFNMYLNFTKLGLIMKYICNFKKSQAAAPIVTRGSVFKGK